MRRSAIAYIKIGALQNLYDSSLNDVYVQCSCLEFEEGRVGVVQIKLP